jgi:DNA-binding transcriptional regulator YhcF (GntR family)
VQPLILDPDSPVPPFEQVRSQLAAAIESGALSPAERVPTVRRLAADLGLAINTVVRAYRELELAGLIESRGRHGTFVTGVPSQTRASATRAARSFVRRMHELGLSQAESLAIVRREIEASLGPSRLVEPA